MNSIAKPPEEAPGALRRRLRLLFRRNTETRHDDVEMGPVPVPKDDEGRVRIRVFRHASSDAATATSSRARPPRTALEHMMGLPLEMWLEIFQYVNFADMIQLKRTCWSTCSIVSNPLLRMVFGRTMRKHSRRVCRRCMKTDETEATLLLPLHLPRTAHHVLVSECIACVAQRGGFAPDVQWWNGEVRVCMCAYCGWPTPWGSSANVQLHARCVVQYRKRQAWCVGISVAPLWLLGGCVVLIVHSGGMPEATVSLLVLGFWLTMLSPGLHICANNELRLYHFGALLDLICLVSIVLACSRVSKDREYCVKHPKEVALLWASVAVVGLVKTLHFAGNVILIFEYKHWMNLRPHSGWPRRAVAWAAKTTAMLVNPTCVKQVYPGRYLPLWVSRLYEYIEEVLMYDRNHDRDAVAAGDQRLRFPWRPCYRHSPPRRYLYSESKQPLKMQLLHALLPLTAAASAIGRGSHAPDTVVIDGWRLAEAKERLSSRHHHADAELKAALGHLTAQADTWLSQGPWTVTTKTTAPPGGSVHDYASQAPYWWPNPNTTDGCPYIQRDGVRNPEVDRYQDRLAVGRMFNSSYVLSLAWYYTGKEAYARHAGDILRTWFLDPATAMNPNLDHAQIIPCANTGRAIGIIDFSQEYTNVLDAVAVLESGRGAPGWSKADAKAFRAWNKQFLTWLTTSPFGKDEASQSNNHGTFANMQISAVALFITGNGSQPQELARTRSWHYSNFNLGAHLRWELVARKSVLKAAGFVVPAAVDGAAAWPYEDLEFVRYAATDNGRGGSAKLQAPPGGDIFALRPAPQQLDSIVTL
ncbi:exported protein [Purpureocillium lavendulum]|uniref:Exported protein n=1 Tax=Purpureocillium lavendulum TaxID=1247861 RepID=A0AB34FK95_9HYPO|nr:exported protein [Purpureocillium lavendulum]